MARVLIVDDDPSIVRMLRLTLATSGFDVRTASDGGEALRVLHHERLDAILLDLNLPIVTGQDVLRRMREGGIATPVVVVSADAAGDARRLGADAVIRKPFRIDAVLNALHACTAPVSPRHVTG